MLLTATSKMLDVFQAVEVRDLLIHYKSTFSTGDTDTGTTALAVHHLESGNASPIRLPPQRVPLLQHSHFTVLAETMLEQDVIEPCCSPWSSHHTHEKDAMVPLGFVWLTGDFTALQKKHSYSPPRTDDIPDALVGSACFSILDLGSGY